MMNKDGCCEGGVTRMKKLRDLLLLAVIAGFAAYQGRQLRMYAASGQAPAAPTTQNAGPTHGGNATPTHPSELAAAGGSLFQQNCAFCHGRDAGGGETGPDLTRSKLVAADVGGDKISDVVLHGRADKGMPAFSFSSEQVAGLVAFIHAQKDKAMAQSGKRKGVDVSDLQTGNVEEGKAYFNGPGGCSTCHSPTGDLAGVASRHEGLELEERMLYPKDVKSKVTVTLPSGEKVAGTLAYLDEFTVGLRDTAGTYRSWRVSDVKYAVDAPVEAHVALFPKYTDADIHNLMAYIQTLR
jgi:cytochrome c oxidase cbb3-type subunit III